MDFSQRSTVDLFYGIYYNEQGGDEATDTLYREELARRGIPYADYLSWVDTL